MQNLIPINAIEAIASYGIPTNSYIQAMSYISGETNIPLQTQSFFEKGVSLILQSENSKNKKVTFEDEIEAKFTFLYLVQETIRSSLKNKNTNAIDDIYQYSHKLATDFIKNNQYIFAQLDEEIKVDTQGNPKQKKGAKKEQAEMLYNKNRGKSKSEIMEIFQKEVGLSKAGAQTYFYNCKNQFGG